MNINSIGWELATWLFCLFSFSSISLWVIIASYNIPSMRHVCVHGSLLICGMCVLTGLFYVQYRCCGKWYGLWSTNFRPFAHVVKSLKSWRIISMILYLVNIIFLAFCDWKALIDCSFKWLSTIGRKRKEVT